MSFAEESLRDGAPSKDHPGGKAPPVLSRCRPLIGHLGALRKNPIELFQRVRDELGEIGEISFAGNRVVMMMGEEAQEAFFRGEDEQLQDQDHAVVDAECENAAHGAGDRKIERDLLGRADQLGRA